MNAPLPVVHPPEAPNSAPPPPPPTGRIIACLLKSPQDVGTLIAGDRGLIRAGAVLIASATLSYAVFGFALGLFGGWQTAAMDVVKAPLVGLCSLLICLPSLYVFACLGGAPLSLRQTFALGATCLALGGLLLVGLAPVAWLFAVSTQSMPFVVILAFVIWFSAMSFTARAVGRFRTNATLRRTAGIRFWFLVFGLVTLQMTTLMRPMLAPPKHGWWTDGKKFFLAHFGETFEHRR